MSRKGDALLAKMRASKHGWKKEDLEKLYKAFGFEQQRSRHILYVHPDYPELRGTVSHTSSSLAIGYVNHAIRTIDSLKSKRGET